MINRLLIFLSLANAVHVIQPGPEKKGYSRIALAGWIPILPGPAGWSLEGTTYQARWDSSRYSVKRLSGDWRSLLTLGALISNPTQTVFVLYRKSIQVYGFL